MLLSASGPRWQRPFQREELTQRLPSGVRKGYSFSVMLKHFELCVLDFVRWWVGYYSGDYFWAMPWALELMRVALNRLDGGQLKTPEERAGMVPGWRRPIGR